MTAKQEAAPDAVGSYRLTPAYKRFLRAFNAGSPYNAWLIAREAALTSAEHPDAALVERKFSLGDRVEKTRGSSWCGHVVGFYSTALTPEGYAVESEREPGSVQIYPAAALASKPDTQEGRG